jgi:hypothetical protein
MCSFTRCGCIARQAAAKTLGYEAEEWDTEEEDEEDGDDVNLSIATDATIE